MVRVDFIAHNHLVVYWICSAFLPLGDSILGYVHLPQEMGSEQSLRSLTLCIRN